MVRVERWGGERGGGQRGGGQRGEEETKRLLSQVYIYTSVDRSLRLPVHPWPVTTHLQSCVLTRQTVHCPQVLPLDSVTLHDLCSLLGLMQCIKNTSSFIASV